METLLNFLHAVMVIAIAALIVGLIAPTRIYCKSRKYVAIYFGIPLVLCYFISKPVSNKVERQKAQKDFEQMLQEITEDPEKDAYYRKKAYELYSEHCGKSSQATEKTKPQKKAADFSCTLKDFSFRKSFGDSHYGLGSTADGIYLIVNISIKNLSDVPRRFPFNDFYVTDTNGARYTFQDHATYLFRTSSFTDWDFEKLDGTRMFQPNVSTRDCMLFEVPQRGEYYLNVAGSSTAVILE